MLLEAGLTLASELSLVQDLELATLAAKEWVGLLAYWAMGRTDALFPDGA